jgi:4-hydroxythreonine-4-phosphate dehydrogenase
VVGRLAAADAPLRPRAAALVVVGGETARRLLLACGVRALDVTGELEPGIATARDPDGRPVLTKSGSFGDDGALARMYEWSRAPLGVA